MKFILLLWMSIGGHETVTVVGQFGTPEECRAAAIEARTQLDPRYLRAACITQRTNRGTG